MQETTRILQKAMAETLFCCYSPTVFNPLGDHKIEATAECIRADLDVLRPYVSGLITYGLKDGLDQVPDVARCVTPPFQAVILGIWDILDPYEVELAIQTVNRHRNLIVAVCCGNEGIYFGRYSKSDLSGAIESLRKALPEVCITSSEPLIAPEDYVLIDCPVDFHSPTIHPWFLPQKSEGPASADWVINQVNGLAQRSALPVLCKETGWPSGGAPEATPQAQQEFWSRLLRKTRNTEDVAYALFEAYDAGPWKVETNAASVEEYWGFFLSPSRHPKPVVETLSPQHRKRPQDCGGQ